MNVRNILDVLRDKGYQSLDEYREKGGNLLSCENL
jgi:hypothetical protein